MSGKDPTYLGDGVYATHDGYYIWLHVGAHTKSPLVALDPDVLAALVAYNKRIRGESNVT